MSENNKVNIDKEMMYKRIMPSSFKREDITESDLYNPELFSDVNSPNSTIHHKNYTLQKQNVEIVNIMQIVIDKRLDMALTKFNCCHCDRCRKDVTAYALNLLESRYIVSKEVNAEEYEKDMNALEINTAIIKAILKIRNNTRH